MRKRIGISLVVVALTLGTALVAVTPAGAAAVHTVTVTPSTGLSDGQTVTVNGTGFDETPLINDWVVTQCSAAILNGPIDVGAAINDCDQTVTSFAHADAAGNISTSLVVHKQFTSGLGAGGGPVTCGQAPNDCAILIAQFADGPTQFVAATAPISFGPPVKPVSQCFRDFFHDHQHGLRHRLVTLLTCVFTALKHHPNG